MHHAQRRNCWSNRRLTDSQCSDTSGGNIGIPCRLILMLWPAEVIDPLAAGNVKIAPRRVKRWILCIHFVNVLGLPRFSWTPMQTFYRSRKLNVAQYRALSGMSEVVETAPRCRTVFIVGHGAVTDWRKICGSCRKRRRVVERPHSDFAVYAS